MVYIFFFFFRFIEEQQGGAVGEPTVAVILLSIIIMTYIGYSRYSKYGIRVRCLYLILILILTIISSLYSTVMDTTVDTAVITQQTIMSGVLGFVGNVLGQSEQVEAQQPPTQPLTSASQSPALEEYGPEQQQQISLDIPRRVDKNLSQRGEALIVGLEANNPIKQRFILLGNGFSETTHEAARTRIVQYDIKSQIPQIAIDLAQQQQQPQLTAQYQQELLHYFVYKYGKDVSERTLKRWLKD